MTSNRKLRAGLKASFASGATLLLCGLVAHATPPPAGIAPVTVPAGGFAIAGGVVAGTAGVNAGSWMSGPGGAGVLGASGAPLNPGTTFHFTDAFNSKSDQQFSGGKWMDDPNSWGWGSGAPSGKNDINNVLMHVATDTNLHTWLILAADRASASGSSFIDFELLQNTLVANANGTFTSAGPNGGRTLNDLDITLSFGNGTADFLAYRWQTNGSGGYTYVDSTASLPTGKVFVAVNTNTVAVPFRAFGQTNYQPVTFIEAAVDMTALMSDFNPCLSIGVKTILIKTKTSASSSASLADFVTPIQYRVLLGPGADAGPDQTQCTQGSSTAFALQGVANRGQFPISSTSWSVVSGTALIDSPNSVTTTAHVSSPSATLRLTVVQANGCIGTSDVVLTVNPIPTSSISGPQSVLPQSTTQFSGPAGMSNYTWSISSNASISGSANSQTVSVVAGSACGATYTLSLDVSANGCGSTATTNILISDTGLPIVTAPANLTLECPANTSTSATGVATAHDNSGNLAVSYSDAVTSTCGGATKVITRTWTAVNVCGYTVSAAQTITVQDTTPPTVTAPQNVTLAFTADISPSSTGVGTAQDGCSAATLQHSDALAVNADGSQMVSRTWTATDGCGNQASAVQTITLTAPSPLVLPSQSDVTLSNLNTLVVTNTASNSNGSTNTLSYQLINPPAGASIDGNGVITWTPTLSESPSTNLITTVVTTIVTSGAGTSTISSTNSFFVIVSSPYPTVTAPPNVTMAFTADISPSSTGVATAQDGCSSATLQHSDALAVNADGSQVISRTWTATDGCGNQASAVQTITLTAPSPLVLPAQSDVTLSNLNTLVVTNTASNSNGSTDPLSYQLINPPAGATIDSNGVITWTPTLSESPSTNLITTVVTTTVTSGAGTSTISSTNSFFVIVSSPYDGLDMSADTDGDGLTNLVEFAVGSNPNDSGDGNSDIVVWITQDSGTNYLAMKFKRRTNAASLGLQYFPEVSADKLSWAADNANVLQLSVDSFDSQFDWVTVRDVTPITPAAARFIHLRVVSASIESASPTWIGTATTVQGNGGTGSRMTMFSQRMVLPIAYAGIVSSLQNTALTDTNATWTTGQFASVTAPSYAEFENGWMVDISGSTSATKSLSLAGNLTGVAAPGDVYRVRQHFTIASLFGTNNETGLKSGESAAQADTILLQMAQNQTVMTIFYYSNQFYHGWVRGDLSPADQQVIYPEQGLMVLRMAPGDRNVYACGPIKTGVAVAPIEPGFNLLGTLKSLSNVNLGALNLYTDNPATGLASGMTASGSDNLMVVKPDGTTTLYFYYNQPGLFSGWVDGALNPAGNVPIPAGSAFFIKRLNASGPFNWAMPAE